MRFYWLLLKDTNPSDRAAAGSSAASGLLEFWDRANLGHYGFLFTLCLILICGATALIGIAPTWIYGQDAFFLLENGWRTLWGLRPHIDYDSAWGPVIFLAEALGLKLTNNSPNAIGVSNALFGAVAGLWVYLLGRNRLGRASRLLAALYATLLICAPYPLGTRPWRSSHAMTYNRYGYALLLVIVIEGFGRQRITETTASEWLAAFSTGLALACTVFLKASFFLVATPLVLLSFLLHASRRDLRRMAGVIAGFSSATFAFLAYLNFDVVGLLHAWQSAAGTRIIRLQQMGPASILLEHRFDLLLLIAAICGALLIGDAACRRGRLTQLTIVGAFFLADLSLALTDTAQSYAMPLLAIFGLLAADRLAGARVVQAASGSRSRQASALAVCGLLFLGHFGMEVSGVAAAAIWKARPTLWKTPFAFTDAHLAPYLLYQLPDDYNRPTTGSTYVNQIDDGIRLLRDHCNPNDRVQAMEMQNPFPFALEWRPPHGGIASTAFNFTISAKYHPSFDAYFGDATAVMVPKHPATPPEFMGGFFALYLPALYDRYSLAAESREWRLYKIK